MTVFAVVPQIAAAPIAARPVINSVLRQIVGVSCAAFAALPAVMFVSTTIATELAMTQSPSVCDVEMV